MVGNPNHGKDGRFSSGSASSGNNAGVAKKISNKILGPNDGHRLGRAAGKLLTAAGVVASVGLAAKLGKHSIAGARAAIRDPKLTAAATKRFGPMLSAKALKRFGHKG